LYNQPETILEQYDVTVSTVKKGRGIYICDTDQGRKILTPFGGSKERAAFLYELLGYLNVQGGEAGRMMLTKEGEVLAHDEAGGAYLLKDMVAGEECSTKRPEQMTGAVEALARLHLCLAECPVEVPEFMRGEQAAVSVLYEKHCRELVKVKNYIKSRNRKNEFEMKFQKEYPHFIEQAKQSLELLAESEKTDTTRMLCHGDVNQHNAVFTGQGWQFINFEHVCCGHPMADLSNFLRKLMEKNDWNRELGMRLVKAYDRVRPISGDEYMRLYVLMLFPEKFWKLANHYYNSHKAWLSGRDIEKLDRIRAQEDGRGQFLENLFSNGCQSCILKA
jgi:CotS family spore coat protein